MSGLYDAPLLAESGFHDKVWGGKMFGTDPTDVKELLSSKLNDGCHLGSQNLSRYVIL